MIMDNQSFFSWQISSFTATGTASEITFILFVLMGETSEIFSGGFSNNRLIRFVGWTVLGETAKCILNKYESKGEICLIEKCYSKQQYVKYYNGLIVCEIIAEWEIQHVTHAGNL